MTVCYTRHSAYSPAAPATPGIVIVVPPRPARDSPLVVCGAFHLPVDEAQPMGSAIHRAVVLLVQHTAESYALTPFHDLVAFADDLVAVPGGTVGYFAIDVFAARGRLVAGDYHLSASIGARLSNVVAVQVA